MKDRRWLRRAVALGAAWALIVSAVAAYEGSVVDPWRFLGEDRGPMFFSWSSHLVYDNSPLGDFVLVFDTARFLLALVGPIAVITALVAVVMRPRQL